MRTGRAVQIEQAPVKPEVFGPQGAGGSRSIPNNWDQLRRAGAVARRMLLIAAAQQWDVPLEQCTTRAGVVLHEGLAAQSQLRRTRRPGGRGTGARRQRHPLEEAGGLPDSRQTRRRRRQ